MYKSSPTMYNQEENKHQYQPTHNVSLLMVEYIVASKFTQLNSPRDFSGFTSECVCVNVIKMHEKRPSRP